MFNVSDVTNTLTAYNPEDPALNKTEMNKTGGCKV